VLSRRSPVPHQFVRGILGHLGPDVVPGTAGFDDALLMLTRVMVCGSVRKSVIVQT
jgi:hypothetical protein